MRFAILQENLHGAMRELKPYARSNRHETSPLYIETQDSGVHLTVIDADGEPQSVLISAKVEADGHVIIKDARRFAEYVALLPPERIDMAYRQNDLSIRMACGASVANWNLNADEWPTCLAQLDANTEPVAFIPAEHAAEWKAAITNVVKSADAKNDREALHNIRLELNGNLKAVAANGYAVHSAILPGAVRTTGDYHVNAKAFKSAISKLCTKPRGKYSSYDDVTIARQGDTLILSAGLKRLRVPLVDCKYPDYEAIIPKAHDTSVVVYTDDLVRAIKRLKMAKDSANSIRLEIDNAPGPGEPGALTITAQSAERGEVTGRMDASVSGDAIALSVNRTYLLNALMSVPTERAVLYFSGATRPVKIAGENCADFIAVIMPMTNESDRAETPVIALPEYRWGTYVVNFHENQSHRWRNRSKRGFSGLRSGTIRRIIAHLEAPPPPPPINLEALKANERILLDGTPALDTD